jgi:hypothetical protein
MMWFAHRVRSKIAWEKFGKISKNLDLSHIASAAATALFARSTQ